MEENQTEELEVKEPTVERVGGYLHRVVPIANKSGEIINYVLKPLMVEFKPRDVIQVVVGAALLAIPVSLTEEAWTLGKELPLFNIWLIVLLSLSLISAFVFFNFYRFNLKGYVWNFIVRVVGTYVLSLLVVGILLTLIEKCPWGTDPLLAFKRIVIVAFPAAMSGTLSDTIK